MAGVRTNPLKSGRYQSYFVDFTSKRKFLTGPKPTAQTKRAREKAKAEALKLAEALEEEHRQIRLGYRPAPKSADTHSKRPFEEVKREYLSWGKSQGGRNGRPWGRTHAEQRENKLAWWQERLSLSTLGDLQGVLPRVEAALREIQAKGRTGKTLANYAENLKSFCLWAKRRGYLESDPLEGLARFDARPSIENRRRPLTAEEIAALAEAAPKRRLLYLTAACTGLRAGELRSLRVRDFDPERGGFELSAEWTKNRQPGFQPLPWELAEAIRENVSGKAEGEPVFHVSDSMKDVFDPDLERAGIPRRNGAGAATFHCLRMSFATLLNDARGTEKEIQSLMRHSAQGLTFKVYTMASPERLRELVESVYERVQSGNREQERAHRVHRLAAGAEGKVIKPRKPRAYGALRLAPPTGLEPVSPE